MIMIPVRTIKSPNDEKYNTEKKTHFIWSRFNLIVSFLWSSFCIPENIVQDVKQGNNFVWL